MIVTITWTKEWVKSLYFLQNSRINIDCETYIFRDPKTIANLF